MSETFPNLKYPPINEAVIELRFSPPLVFKDLESLYAPLKDEFPKKTTVFSGQVKFKSGEGRSLSTEITDFPEYLKIASKDNNKIVQLKADRFSFSFVGFYTNWEEFSGQALDVWWKIVENIKVESITRLGVRFINNLNLPQGMDLSEFVRNTPEIPQGIPAKIAGFLTQSTISNTKFPAYGTVSLALDRNKIDQEKLPVIFDIDVFYLKKLKNTIDELKPKLLDLRNFKNQIFFHSLTTTGRELYK